MSLRPQRLEQLSLFGCTLFQPPVRHEVTNATQQPWKDSIASFKDLTVLLYPQIYIHVANDALLCEAGCVSGKFVVYQA